MVSEAIEVGLAVVGLAVDICSHLFWKKESLFKNFWMGDKIQVDSPTERDSS